MRNARASAIRAAAASGCSSTPMTSRAITRGSIAHGVRFTCRPATRALRNGRRVRGSLRQPDRSDRVCVAYARAETRIDCWTHQLAPSDVSSRSSRPPSARAGANMWRVVAIVAEPRLRLVVQRAAQLRAADSRASSRLARNASSRRREHAHRLAVEIDQRDVTRGVGVGQIVLARASARRSRNNDQIAERRTTRSRHDHRRRHRATARSSS